MCIFDESLDYIQYSFVEFYVRREKSSYGKFLASVKGSAIELRYEYFFNGYNGFVLIFKNFKKVRIALR